jgi:ribosomal protein S18 acetylase RimI-like enzyme
MEIANHWSQLINGDLEVRVAQQADAEAITKLLRDASYSHIHADWHYPSEWLGSPSFVLIPRTEERGARDSLTSRLFGNPTPLAACLGVGADPLPAAWVRIAAVADESGGEALMAGMLAAVFESLREAGVNQIAWLLIEDWPERWLRDLGFEVINEVITYEKEDSWIPEVAHPPGLLIEPVQRADLVELAAIEARAFEPLWRHSETALALAAKQALSFDVAWLGERPIGFQFSSATRRGAHLSRITVDPAAQRTGIGRALLAHALHGYHEQGITSITLNTQLDNIASQKLYEQFGFRHNWERFPIWNLDLV